MRARKVPAVTEAWKGLPAFISPGSLSTATAPKPWAEPFSLGQSHPPGVFWSQAQEQATSPLLPDPQHCRDSECWVGSKASPAQTTADGKEVMEKRSEGNRATSEARPGSFQEQTSPAQGGNCWPEESSVVAGKPRGRCSGSPHSPPAQEPSPFPHPVCRSRCG